MVCSCRPTTALGSADESLTRFVEQCASFNPSAHHARALALIDDAPGGIARGVASAVATLRPGGWLIETSEGGFSLAATG
jgi:hypothetical protein